MITTSTIHDTRYKSKKRSGKYPVKLRVYDGRTGKKRLYALQYGNFRIYLTKESWRQLQLQRVKSEKLRELKKHLTMELDRARACVRQLRPFTFAGFERLFFEEEKAGTLKELFKEKKATLDSPGAKKHYDTTWTKIEQFDSRELLPHDITLFWLKRFEAFCHSTDDSGITKMQNIRAVLNYAADKGVYDRKLMPFGRSANKYSIPVHRRQIKKTLTLAELKKLFAYEAEPGSEKYFALNMFKLSFHLNGANMADLFRLTPENIERDKVVFIRHKTARTSRTGRKVVARYDKTIQDIFRAIGSENGPYLIPLLDPGMSAKKKMEKVNNKVLTINRNLQDMAEELRIDKKITTTYARHSLATLLRNQNVSPDKIKNILGHGSLSTTEHYLESLDDEEITKIYDRLNLEEGGRATDE
jgi:integrase/recombinase XerD